MEKIVPKDNEKFLTTSASWDIEELIKSLPNQPIPTCVIQIEPKTGNTGLLEERGQWVKAFWNKVIGEEKIFEGHRSNWTQLIIFSPSKDLKDFTHFISKHLKSSTEAQLKSLAIFSMVNGSFDEKISEIEKMDLQLNKINYWNEHLYPSYFENGIEKNLKITSEL